MGYFTASLPTATAQTIDEITQTVQSGSSKALGKFLQDNITLSINNTLSDYSKHQAEQVLKDFFRKNPPKEFKLLHQDGPANKNWHIIAQYRGDDANFRVLIKGAEHDGKLIISTIEFTKE